VSDGGEAGNSVAETEVEALQTTNPAAQLKLAETVKTAT